MSNEMSNDKKMELIHELIVWARGEFGANEEAFPPNDGDSLFAEGKRQNELAGANCITLRNFYNRVVEIEEGPDKHIILFMGQKGETSRGTRPKAGGRV